MSHSPLEDFQPDPDGLAAALEALVEHRGAPGQPHPQPIGKALPDEWPGAGLGGTAALSALAPMALEHPARLDHAGFLAHMDPPTPWFTWAATQWASATNQNLLHPDVAPQMRELEAAVIGWIAPTFGMDGGHLVPGSTVANLTALWAARDLRAVDEVVSSEAAHLSIRKAAHLLGLRHRTVAVGSDQAIDSSALGDLSSSALVLTAGTAGCGAIDDLSLADEHQERASWVHVDAAWAGPLRFSNDHAGMLQGVEAADSTGFSAHKWLHQPKESAAVLFADTVEANQVLSYGGGYLSAPNVGLLGSAGARALPLAATLLAWGRDGVAEVIHEGMARIDDLRELVHADPAFEIFGPHEHADHCGVLLWRPLSGNPDARSVQRHLVDAWVSIADIDGESWFRSVGANPMADAGLVLAQVRHAVHQARSVA